MVCDWASLQLNRFAIHLRSVPVARPIVNRVIATRTATRPSMASFDQAFLAADMLSVFKESGNAATCIVNMNMRT